MNSSVPTGTQIVILQTGGNAARRGVSSGEAAVNTATMTSKLEARAIKVLLLDRLDAPASTRDPDGEHFNAQGHAAVAASLLPPVIAAAGK
jgi:acyl-CoA thioesterase-1